MTKAKHTPGPWVYVEDDFKGEFFGCGVAQHKGASEFVWFDDGIDVETDIATARLIAAAPDLLEALEAMLSHTNGWDETQLRKRWGEQVVAEILAARAAIAKAKEE